MKQNINPLLKASVFYIIGNGIGQGLILLGTIIFTRIMTQTDYGIYSTYYSIVSILTTLVGANLFISLNNGYIDYKEEIHQFRASVLLLSTLVFILISIVVFSGSLVIKIDISGFLLIFALLHAYSFFVVNYFNYSANMENRYKIKTFFLITPNILQVVFSVVLIYVFANHGLYARVVGSTLGVASCALYLYIYIMKNGQGRCDSKFWSYALKISVPSVLSSISYMLMQQCDNIMITRFYSADETAVYSLVYYVGYIIYAVLQATSGVWQAWIYHALDGDETGNVKKVQKWYLFVFAQMAYGLLMIAPEVVKILAPESYWNFNYVAPFVLGSCIMVMYTFYTTIGMFYKKSSAVSLCVFIAAIVNIILNYLLIPKFGGVAAAYTSVCGYFILFILSRKLGQKLKYGLFSDKYFIVFSLTIMIGCILFLCIYKNILIRYMIYMILLILSICYMIKNKNEILPLVKRE